MPTFGYVVKDRSGRTHHGTLETESRTTLMEQLWKQEFVVLSIEERQKGGSFLGRLVEPTIKMEILVVFSRQLATMVDSGIPVVSALDILAEQSEHPPFQRILRKLRDDVEAGSGLSEAMRRHPAVFSEFVVNMIRAGESSGQLDEILDRIASYLEKTEVLRRKVQASLAYPAFVSVMAFSITALLVIYIVPQFKEIFTSLGGELPLPTRILLMVSDAARQYWVGVIVIMGAVLVLLRLYLKTKVGRLGLDRLTLRLPIFGKLIQKVAVSRFARTLATLANSGVPILNAMEIVAKTSGNLVVERAVLTARTSIREGENIATPLSKSKVFPPMVTRMIAVGERTGQLEKMLVKIADFYENEVDAAVTAITSLIEPMVIGVLGLIIGGVVIALFLPVFKITTLLQ